MASDLRERLLVSYADLGEAMVVQNVLQADGVACRVADLAGVPSHLFGITGPMGRSVGLWVLEADAERAASLLATMSAAEGGVDEDALAAEALAAAAPGSEEPVAEREPAPALGRAATVRAARAPWFVTVLFVLVPALAVLLASRGCG